MTLINFTLCLNTPGINTEQIWLSYATSYYMIFNNDLTLYLNSRKITTYLTHDLNYKKIKEINFKHRIALFLRQKLVLCGNNVSFSGHILKICSKAKLSSFSPRNSNRLSSDNLEYCLEYRVLRNRTENLSKIK